MPLSPALKKRAADFLQRTIPAELEPNYVSGSIAEIVISLCAQGESLDPELGEMAEMAVGDYDTVIAEAQAPELKTYYTDCQQLVRDIVQAS
ncbi:hypothetical protein [Brevifollis gellanilyticus]|uniref:Uncharacterized protein n=1 Tax=Brevifollis gellanilyticus TaxID=748831 RepID=A0A512MHC9_9BACT|nr:hypothetical protein [Brevifollis gellanilyticus]GEP46136.1 hypothetical protein BGE01nite_54270 [Brevifollis gellanilyticus]